MKAHVAMKLTALWLMWCLTGACAAQTMPAPVREAPVSSAQASLAQRQILLMLRIAPAHYRPDANYGADYRIGPGRVARRHIAEELARAHGLQLHAQWPMPALGVECFVLDASDRTKALREAQALAADPRVESAQAMELFHALGNAAADSMPSNSMHANGMRADNAPASGRDPLYATQPAAAQ